MAEVEPATVTDQVITLEYVVSFLLLNRRSLRHVASFHDWSPPARNNATGASLQPSTEASESASVSSRESATITTGPALVTVSVAQHPLVAFYYFRSHSRRCRADGCREH